MKKIFKYPKIIVGIIFIVTLILALQIPNIKINNDIEVFLPDNHQAKVTNRKIEDIFGNNDQMVVAVNVKNGTIFQKNNIKLIDSITNNLENIQGIDEVT